MNQDNDIDCIGEWSTWSKCSHNCNGGLQSRGYNIIYPGLNNGSPCLFTNNDVQYKDCNNHPCNDDCIVGEWGEWGECSKVCDGGTHVRKRSIIPPRYITFIYDTKKKEYDSCLNEQLLETYYQVGSEEFTIPEITDASISGGIGNILADRPKYKNKYGYVIVVVRLGDINNPNDQMVLLTLGSEKISRIVDLSHIMAKLGEDNMMWDENNKSYKSIVYSNITFHPVKVDANSSSTCVSKYNPDLSFFTEPGLTMEIRNISDSLLDKKEMPPFTKNSCSPDVIFEESNKCNVESCAINQHEITTENDYYIEIILNKSQLSLRIPINYESFINSMIFPRTGPHGPDLILFDDGDDTPANLLNCSKTTELASQINCAEDDLYDCVKQTVNLENISNNSIFFNEIIELLPNSTSIKVLSNYRKCNVPAYGYYLDTDYNVKNCYEIENKIEAEKNQACITVGENYIVLPRSSLILYYPRNYRDISDIVISKSKDKGNQTNIMAYDKNNLSNRECTNDSRSQYNCDIDSLTNECILDGIESLNNASSTGNIELFEDLSEFFSTNRTIQILSDERKCDVPNENYYLNNESNVKPCSSYNYKTLKDDVNGFCKKWSIREDSDKGSSFLLTILISTTIIGFIVLLLYLLIGEKPQSTKIHKSKSIPEPIKYKTN